MMDRTPTARKHIDRMLEMFANNDAIYDPWPELWEGLNDQQRRACIEYSKLSTAPKNVPDRWEWLKEGERVRIKQAIFQFAGLAAKLSAAERKLIHGAKNEIC